MTKSAISNNFTQKFKIDDRAIISTRKNTEKEYTPRWTKEVFTISQVQYVDPPTYKITNDYN